MDTAIQIQSPAEQIAELHARVVAAEQRATVAEEQLRRVHRAVRAFKHKQTQARAAQIKAHSAQAEAQKQAGGSGFYQALADADPTLDDRLDEFLESDFEPDRARSWMLGS